MDLCFHFAQEFFDGAELDDAVMPIFVLKEPRELNAARGVLVAAFQQHFARAERDGAEVGGGLLQCQGLFRHKFFPHTAGSREADPWVLREFGSGGDLCGVNSGNKRGQRRVAAGEFAQDDVPRRRRGLGQDVQEVPLFLRERVAAFEVFDGLFRKKLFETRHHGDARLERSVDGRHGWRREMFQQLARVGLGPEEFAALGVDDDASDLLVDARVLDVGGDGLRLNEQMLQPAGTAGVDVAWPGVDGFGEFVEFGGEREDLVGLCVQSETSNVDFAGETSCVIRRGGLLQREKFRIGDGWGAVNQALLALTGPINVIRGGAPAGFAFDAVFKIDDELRLAEVVGETFVDPGGANVPERGLGDLGAVLEVLGTEDLDVRVMLGEIADERKLFLPRLLDSHSVGVKLHAVTGECTIFLEEAGEEFLR